MFKLVRDNVPLKILENQSFFNYAQIQNTELFQAFLTQRLVDDVNSFMMQTTIEGRVSSLIDVITAAVAICKTHNIDSEAIKSQYEQILSELGAYDSRYIEYEPDRKIEESGENA